MNYKRKIVAFFLSLIISFSKISAKEALPLNSSSLQSFPTLRSAISGLFPQENISVKMANQTIILTGVVSNPENADKIERLALQYAENNAILNFMKLKTSQQVLLKVKIAEIERKHAHFVNNPYNTDLDLLERNGVVRLLAEPNLVSISGEEARFESGGSLPVGNYRDENLEYKSYGVKVRFTPTILSSNRIRLNVEPELSNFSEETFPKKASSTPHLNTRKAKTIVELAPGESFMIAGLVQDFHEENKRSSKELIISVTPYLVDPLHNKDLRNPTDVLYIHSNLEKKFVENLIEEHKLNLEKEKLNKPIGYMVE